MKKLTILLMFLNITALIAQTDTVKNINFNYYHLKVSKYCQAQDSLSDYRHIEKDTTISDFKKNRKLILSKNNSEFELGFPTNDSDFVYLTYKVAKTDTITHESNNKQYTYYLGFDDEQYPLVIYISEQDAIIYYYYSSKAKKFLKSEKLTLTKN
jgi:hypothetical protein